MIYNGLFRFDKSPAFEEVDDGGVKLKTLNRICGIKNRLNEEIVLLVLDYGEEDIGDPNIKKSPNPFNGVTGAFLISFKIKNISLADYNYLYHRLDISLFYGILSRCYLGQNIRLASFKLL